MIVEKDSKRQLLFNMNLLVLFGVSEALMSIGHRGVAEIYKHNKHAILRLCNYKFLMKNQSARKERLVSYCV